MRRPSSALRDSDEKRSMKCRRCGGLIVGVAFSGGETATGAWAYSGWKCLNCGYVTDPLILKNRIAQSQGTNCLQSTVERANELAPSLGSRHSNHSNREDLRSQGILHSVNSWGSLRC